tara:strand:- start:174 stop:431 length:258 start_codon:yes stop_codon:yes gene_type:complete
MALNFTQAMKLGEKLKINNVAKVTKKTSKLQKLLKNPKTKKFLQAGAMATEAGSKGSAGNIASKIIGFDDDDTEKAAGQPTTTHY